MSGEHDRLIPAGYDQNQTSNLNIPQQQRDWHSIYCSKRVLFIVLCISVAIAVIVSLVVGGSVLLAVTNPSHKSTTILTQGTYVKLKLDASISQNVSSTLSVSVNNSNTVVELYNVKCSKLNNYVNTKYTFSPTPYINGSYFRNCSRWPGKCPYEQYRYLVKAPNADIVNAINIQQPLNPGKTIRVLVYDDEERFYKYLHGSGHDISDAIFTAVINGNLSEQYIHFGNNNMIKQQSYYFSAIEEVGYDGTEPAEWFRVRCSSMIASYSGLGDVEPNCTLNSNNRICSIPLASTDPYCFIGYYNNTLEDGSSSDFAVEAKVELISPDSTKTTTAKKSVGGVLVAVSVGILIALVAASASVYCYIQKVYRR